MPRQDNFFNQPANSDGYYLSDAWVAFGGEYIYIEWTKDSAAGFENERWVRTPEFFDFTATDGDFVGETLEIRHDFRSVPGDSTVVTITIKSPRIIAKDETVALVALSSGGFAGIASNFEQVSLPTDSDTTIRNYSMVTSAGALLTTVRTGTSPYFVQTDPETDPNFDFSMSDGTLNTSEGLLEGTNLDLRTRRGAISMNVADEDFNGEKSFQGSGNWIGEMIDFTGFSGDFTWIFAVNMPVNSKFHYSLVEETGGSVDGPGGINAGSGGTQFGGRPISTDLNAIFSFNSSAPVSYTITDYWTYDAALESHRFRWSSPTNVGVGKITDRTHVFAIKYDSSAGKITVYGGGGNPIDEINHTTTNPTLGANEYFAFRTENQAKFTEILNIDSAVDDVKIQEYLCYLDDKYATQSVAFYVDTVAGDDTSSGGESGALKTIEEALNRCMAASGDQVFIKYGQTLSSSSSIDMFPSDIQQAPIGYSPDHPFIFGGYGSRSGGRFVIDYDADVENYLNTNQHNENILIFGLNLKSSERDINSGSFVGQDTLKGLSDGYGIYKRSTGHLFQHSAEGMVVYDCEINNALRHGITSTSIFTTAANVNKYSAVVRTGIRNLYNANYMSINQNHAIGSSNYGIAGIFAEKIAGLHVQDCMFYRVGWSPDLYVDSGISVGTLFYAEGHQALTGNALFPYLTPYDHWEGSDFSDHNNQRILIHVKNGSPYSEIAYVSSGIDLVTGSTLGIYTKSPLLLADGDSCSIKVLDPFPRCSGNADIVIGDNSFGHMNVTESIFIESSGHNIVSNNSILQCDCISENNQFGTLMNSEYTKIKDNYFGGTSGTDIIRKAPNNRSITIGDIEIIDEVSNHGWMIKSLNDSRILSADISGNIFSRENGYGFEATKNSVPLNSAIHFDKNNSPYFNVNIEKNTFWSIPGMIISFSTENTNSSSSITYYKNILDQEIDYLSGSFGSSASSYMYGFKDGFSNNFTNIWGPMNFGGATRRGIYNQRDLTNPPVGGMVLNFRPSFIYQNLGYAEWRALEASDFGDWVDVVYTDVPRSIAKYNSSQLAGSTSAIEFASNAFADNDISWSTEYTVEEVLSYIRTGWQPTNLDQVDYNNDYVGAVEFNFTPATTGFKPYFGNDGENFGFGKGK